MEWHINVYQIQILLINSLCARRACPAASVPLCVSVRNVAPVPIIFQYQSVFLHATTYALIPEHLSLFIAYECYIIALSPAVDGAEYDPVRRDDAQH